jgi:hypothetical protein
VPRESNVESIVNADLSQAALIDVPTGYFKKYE